MPGWSGPLSPRAGRGPCPSHGRAIPVAIAIVSLLTHTRAPECLVLCVQRTPDSFHVMWVRHCKELNGLSLGSLQKEIAEIFLVPEGGIAQNLKIQTARSVKAPSEKLVHLLDCLH